MSVTQRISCDRCGTEGAVYDVEYDLEGRPLSIERLRSEMSRDGWREVDRSGWRDLCPSCVDHVLSGVAG